MNSKRYVLFFSVAALSLFALTGCETQRSACEREKRLTQRIDEMQMDLDGRIGSVNAEVAGMRSNPPVVVAPAPAPVISEPVGIRIEDDYAFSKRDQLEALARSNRDYSPPPRSTPRQGMNAKHVRVPVPVKTVQAALREAGFYQGSLDGKVGNQTVAAISAFQRAQGLKADGVVGRATWQHLQAFVPAGMSTTRLK